MDSIRNAVKAFIVNDGKLLLVKRRSNDPHEPGTWDNPGGRLEPGESPFLGLQREVREETGLEVDIKAPLDVHYFTRDDGQRITMIIFVCKIRSGEIKLSEEHTEYVWKNLSDTIETFPKNFQCCVKRFKEVDFQKIL